MFGFFYFFKIENLENSGKKSRFFFKNDFILQNLGKRFKKKNRIKFEKKFLKKILPKKP